MDQIEIAIGTYENLILGYRIEKNVGSEGYTLESSFTTDSHCGALRCLAVSPQGVLVSSSTDDSIRLHSLKKRKEVGSLFQHDGSVNCIRFFKGGHMFSASEDGTICLWKCKNWELLRVFKGHRCHVMAVSVHPSGKLALSVGNDRTFFTWDMTTGKLAFKRKTDEVAQDVLFTNDGNHYVIVYQKKLEVCSLEDTEVIHEIKYDNRINIVCFVEGNLLAVGGDDGSVYIVNVLSNAQILHKSFKGRVRTMCALETVMGLLLFVASSSGHIRICKLDLTEGDESIEAVADYGSGTRLTCMAAYSPPEILKAEEEENENVTTEKSVKEKPKKKRKASGMNENHEDQEVRIKDEEENKVQSENEEDASEDEQTLKQNEKKRKRLDSTPNGNQKRRKLEPKTSAKKEKPEKKLEPKSPANKQKPDKELEPKSPAKKKNPEKGLEPKSPAKKKNPEKGLEPKSPAKKQKQVKSPGEQKKLQSDKLRSKKKKTVT